MALPQKTVEAVISHQFQSMVEAMRIHQSIEMSGFGRFVLKPKWAKRALEASYLRLELCEGDIAQPGVKKDRMKQLEFRHNLLEEKIEALKILLHET